MMETLDRYLSAGFFWLLICLGLLMAFNSYDSYGNGLGAMMLGSCFIFYSLRRLYKASRASKVQLQDYAIVVLAFLMTGVGVHGSGSFIQEHEAKFAPLLAALEQYRNTTGQYPDELAELLPGYVTSLPECPVSGGWAGDSYYYKRKKGHRFEGTYLIQCVVGAFLFPQRGLYESDDAEWWYTD